MAGTGRFSIFAFIGLITAAAVAATRDLGHAIERGVDRLLAMFPYITRDPALAFEGYHDLELAGDALPPALLNELRHESGMKHRAAARHT